MIINQIYLQNFRSYGSEGFTLSFSPNTNTIIGENNVGKTTILAALKKILILESADTLEDYFARNAQKEMKISIECILDDDQIASLISTLNLPYNKIEFMTYFSNQITYTYTRVPGKAILNIKIGFLQIENGPNPNGCKGYIEPIHRDENYAGVIWNNIIVEINKNKNTAPEIIIKKVFNEFSKSNPNSPFSIDFQTEVYKTVISILKSKIIFLDEFREKPQTTITESSSSSTGKELTSVLYKLKLGEKIEDRNNYSKIQNQFKQLFPHLKMDIIKTGEDFQIEIRKNHIVSTTHFIGSGIIQTLFLLTHVFAHPNKILFIDTPELHLHPHIQRRLGTLLQSSQGGQLILLTHSQYFLPISKESRIFRLIQEGGETRVICPSVGFFTDSDYNIFDQILTIDNKEFFFSRLVLLVEGMSDQWVMQIFATAEGFDLDEHGISIVPVNGNHNFERYLKILEGYQIPWMIMVDGDAKNNIESVKTVYPNAKAFLLDGELEDVLDPDFMMEGRTLFGDGKDKKDKPLKARFAAKKMIEKGMPVPESIKQVILELKKWNECSN
jgi:predicted ATP-dependent endonuclease of OLD family